MVADPKPADWALLGVAVDCSRAEARAAYVARATVLHPDHHPGAPDELRHRLDREMAELNAAWDRLERWDGREAADPPADPADRRTDVTDLPRLPDPPPGLVVNHLSVAAFVRRDALELVGSAASLFGLAAVSGAPYRVLRCTDRRLRHAHVAAVVEHLPHLTALDLAGTGVGDAIVPLLARLPELTALQLSDTAVTDAGLRGLGRFSRLQSLSLVDTAVTDAGLAHLRDHPRLVDLNLRGTEVRGPGLVHLATCPSLRLLALPHVERHDRRELADRRPDIALV